MLKTTLNSPIEQSNLVAQVELRLYRAMASGELKPGARIVEAELSRRLEISRAPIREAARRLEKRGLVRWIPRRGFFVRELTARDVVEIYGTRIALEAYAVPIAATLAGPEDLEALNAILTEVRSATAEHDSEKLVEADLAFHRRVCSITGNARLLAAFDDLASELRLALTFVNRGFGTGARFESTHQGLLKALTSGDGEAARRAFIAHLEHSCEVLSSSLAAAASQKK
ncbi:GntR family transcriptional regulator [Bosea sp. (in: a-proteobacteria)]|uniref:GntR family transcriptional regulator n=1 Tax=Bosea sp. (in: a-proteobacteria) TaxID=1871050 RepID=UPI0026252248|nr:GntR family transcriptional regulator [Bosea sp. (in: a-proteobacteria)]MCO5093146.1 GntR family transcriptional regulator [Bosea sp. (in: a-proteobacteria)]